MAHFSGEIPNMIQKFRQVREGDIGPMVNSEYRVVYSFLYMVFQLTLLEPRSSSHSDGFLASMLLTMNAQAEERFVQRRSRLRYDSGPSARGGIPKLTIAGTTSVSVERIWGILCALPLNLLEIRVPSPLSVCTKCHYNLYFTISSSVLGVMTQKNLEW